MRATSESKENAAALVSAKQAAVELQVHYRTVLHILREMGMRPAIDRGNSPGKGRPSRLSREQVEQIRAYRVAKAEARARDKAEMARVIARGNVSAARPVRFKRLARIQFTTDATQKEMLTEYAVRHDMTQSHVCRLAIELFLKRELERDE